MISTFICSLTVQHVNEYHMQMEINGGKQTHDGEKVSFYFREANIITFCDVSYLNYIVKKLSWNVLTLIFQLV